MPGEQEKIEVVNGEENFMNVTRQFLSKASSTIDFCADQNGPSVLIKAPAYKGLLQYIKEKNIRFRFIVDITKENINYCKEIMNFAEIRYLEGIMGSFSVSEEEYMATAALDEAKPILQLIFSNHKNIVKQHRYLFEILWNKALPAEQRIKQIEENRGIEKTEVFYGPEEAINAIAQFQRRTMKKWDACVESTTPPLSMGKVLKQGYLDACSRGVKIRYVTEITTDNLSSCKEIMKVATLRHLDNVKGSFAVSESEYVAGIKEKEERNSAVFEHVVYSSANELVAHQQSVFDSFWQNAIPAGYKIRELEEGIGMEKTEIVYDLSKAKALYVGLVASAKDEILLVLPSINAFQRVHGIGIIEKLLEKAKSSSSSSSGNHVHVRIITPSDSFVDSILHQDDDRNNSNKNESNSEKKQKNFFNFRSMVDPATDVKITSLVVDKRVSLVIELKDDSKVNFVDAIGSCTYSTSKPTVLSYIAIFENLWRQIALYEHLEAHEKMQKDFINVAAHELRTPAQSLVGYAELMLTDPQFIQLDKKEGFLDAMHRNSIRPVFKNVNMVY